MTEVIYEDKHIIVVNKEPGKVVFSDKEDSVASVLALDRPYLKEIGGERGGAVHRLDKDTSGVVVFAKSEKDLSFMQEQFLAQKAKKTYIALVFKKVKRDKGRVDVPIGRSPKNRKKQIARAGEKREAVTFFKTLKRFNNHSLLCVFPKSGRKHQIRCHLSHMGHPVAGDALYGFKDQKDPQELNRMFLHARSLKIKTPKGKMIFTAPLPKDLKKVIHNLKKDVC